MSNDEALNKFPHGAVTILAAGEKCTKIRTEALKETVILPVAALLTVNAYAQDRYNASGDAKRSGLTLRISIDGKLHATSAQTRVQKPIIHEVGTSYTCFLKAGTYIISVERDFIAGNGPPPGPVLRMNYFAVLARPLPGVDPEVKDDCEEPIS